MLLRKIAIGMHLFVGGWLIVNGLLHQIFVLLKARSGTLAPHANVSSLLWVGAGLLVAGAAFSATVAPLMRTDGPSVWAGFGAVAVLAVVLAITARAYGFTFLRGSIALGTIDAVVLIALAVR